MSELNKVRENRLRRMADRQGLALRKSRRRDPRALDFGAYYLVDAAGEVVLGGYSIAALDDVEEYLTTDVEGYLASEIGTKR